MYKYTYMLSQSYRNDSVNLAPTSKIYASNAHILPHSNVPKVSSSFKNIIQTNSRPNNQNNNAIGDQRQCLRQRSNINCIEVKKLRTNQSKYQSQLANNSRPNPWPNQNLHTVKEISQKYSHHLKSSLPNENKNPKKQFQKHRHTENEITNVSRTKDYIKISDQSTFQRPKHPHSRCLQAKSQDVNMVNRSKIRSEIAVHLHKSKANKQLLTGQSLPKKYNYNLSNNCSSIPSGDKLESTESSATVAKLTSLQQRIKSTVQPYIHY